MTVRTSSRLFIHPSLRRLSTNRPPGDAWKPTKEWLDSWKSHLPSATVMALIRATEPALEVLEKVSGRVGNEEDALRYTTGRKAASKFLLS